MTGRDRFIFTSDNIKLSELIIIDNSSLFLMPYEMRQNRRINMNTCRRTLFTYSQLSGDMVPVGRHIGRQKSIFKISVRCCPLQSGLSDMQKSRIGIMDLFILNTAFRVFSIIGLIYHGTSKQKSNDGPCVTLTGLSLDFLFCLGF